MLPGGGEAGGSRTFRKIVRVLKQSMHAAAKLIVGDEDHVVQQFSHDFERHLGGDASCHSLGPRVGSIGRLPGIRLPGPGHGGSSDGLHADHLRLRPHCIGDDARAAHATPQTDRDQDDIGLWKDIEDFASQRSDAGDELRFVG